MANTPRTFYCMECGKPLVREYDNDAYGCRPCGRLWYSHVLSVWLKDPREEREPDDPRHYAMLDLGLETARMVTWLFVFALPHVLHEDNGAYLIPTEARPLMFALRNLEPQVRTPSSLVDAAEKWRARMKQADGA